MLIFVHNRAEEVNACELIAAGKVQFEDVKGDTPWDIDEFADTYEKPVPYLRQHAKYYLGSENDRNTHHGDLFMTLIKEAFGVDEVVMVGHHFVFEPSQDMVRRDLSHMNELPSADTTLFDHPIMTAVFGDKAIPLMQAMAGVPVEQRDEILRAAFIERAKSTVLA